jgi:ankyrin repeat protein
VGVLEPQVKMQTADEKIFNQACQYLKKKGCTTPTFQSWLENPNQKDDRSDTLLHFALKNDLPDNLLEGLFKIFLKNPKRDVNTQGRGGVTILHIAAKRDYPEICKLLLEQEHIQVNCTALNWNVPLYLTVDTNIADNTTPLHLAIDAGAIEVIQLLLAHPRIDVNAVNHEVRTPLHMAIHKRSRQIVEALLSHPRINVNQATGVNPAPLSLAVDFGVIDIVKLLLNYPGIDVDWQDEDGISALHCAGIECSVELLQLLLAEGANPNLEDNLDGSTALDYVIGNINENEGETAELRPNAIAAAKVLLLSDQVDEYDPEHPIIKAALEEIQAEFKTGE